MATLRVIRDKEYINGLRNIGIYVDGNKVTKLSSGSTRDIEVTEGSHTVYAKMTIYTSPTVVFKATKEMHIIRIGSTTKPVWFISATFVWSLLLILATRQGLELFPMLLVFGLGLAIFFIAFLVNRKKYFWIYDDKAKDNYRGPGFSDLY